MALRWAAQRQIFYASIVLVLVLIFSIWFYFAQVYSPASCFDRIQNQDETGIDCGGSCALLCEAPNISAVWTRSVQVAPGVYHAIALIRNPDTRAEGSFDYSFSLFDEENILVATREGTFTIRPGEVVPLFEPTIVSGERNVTRTFIDITPHSFSRKDREESPVRVLSWNLDEENLRLSAVIENQSVNRIENATVTALLYDSEDVLITASQTQSGVLNARERKTITYTWQEPFSKTPQQVDISLRIE